MEPEIVSRPAFTVVGTKYRGKNQNKEIPGMWDNQFLPRVEEIKNRSNPKSSTSRLRAPQSGKERRVIDW